MEPVPDIAASLFGPRLPLAERYAALLASSGVEWGLLGPHEVDRLWTRHLVNCAAVSRFVPRSADVLDVGSGAGLPGIPLALARPDLAVTLIEPLERRLRFLTLCRDELGLDAVELLPVRAEALSGRRAAAVVTARALAPLRRLVALCWPLVRPAGELLAVKGRSAAAELAAAHGRLPGDLAGPATVARATGPDGLVLATVVRLRKGSRNRPGEGISDEREGRRRR